jgi:hypothetical protein
VEIKYSKKEKTNEKKELLNQFQKQPWHVFTQIHLKQQRARERERKDKKEQKCAYF